jgi:hypothetical protein
MACASFIVCVRAVFESDMMMHGYCGGASSCAMISAMSSAVLLHVFVGVVCGDFCLLCLMCFVYLGVAFHLLGIVGIHMCGGWAVLLVIFHVVVGACLFSFVLLLFPVCL